MYYYGVWFFEVIAINNLRNFYFKGFGSENLFELIKENENVVIGGLSIQKSDSKSLQVKITLNRGREDNFIIAGFVPLFAYLNFKIKPRQMLLLNGTCLSPKKNKSNKSLYRIKVRFANMILP